MPKANYMIEERLLDLNNPYTLYLLGFIWADGHIYPKYNRITIEFLHEDYLNLEHIFNYFGNWSKYIRQRAKRRKQIALACSVADFKQKLYQLNYKNKKDQGPNLKEIPNDKIHYWFRGLSDGDGCFYYNKKNKTRQFVISSHYEQDWSYFAKLAVDIKINYFSKTQPIAKNGNKCSKIRLTGFDSIEKWGNYIYQNYTNDGIGLHRKYEKFQQIINSYNN